MPQKRKRVSQKVLRRRRITALIILILILIISIALISSSCSKDDDTKKDTKSISTTQSTTDSVQNSGNSALQNPIGTDTVTSTTSSTVTETTETTTVTGEQVQSISLTFYTCDIEIDETVLPWVTMYPEDLTVDNAYDEKWESSDTSIATVDEYGYITGVKSGICYVTVTSVNNPLVYAQVEVKVKDENGLIPTVTSSTSSNSNTSLSSTTTQQTVTTTVQPVNNPSEPTYIQGILIANKTYSLPQDYNPGLNADAESQFYKLSADASNLGLNIYISSDFRSYDTQLRIYNSYVDSYGQAAADTFSARPGYSDHQTGLAIDVNTIDDSFGYTEESDWLAEHAHEYGFIIRYPEGKEDVTGYKYEPWHIRYLGGNGVSVEEAIEKATAIYNSGLSLEEYLGITSVYPD